MPILSVILLLLFSTAVKVHGECDSWDPFCVDNSDYENPSGCEKNHRWGDECQYGRCRCLRDGCQKPTDEFTVPCCPLCGVEEECNCNEYCARTARCCTGCPDGKMNAVTGDIFDSFNYKDELQVIRSGEEFQFHHEAEEYCVNRDMELAYVRTRKDEVELEKLINTLVGLYPEGYKKFWIDGTTKSPGEPWPEWWPILRDNRYEFCLSMVNQHKNRMIWKATGMQCNALDFQKKEALCARKNYRYKLVIIENDEKISHSENGQQCYDRGIEMASVKSIAEGENLRDEINRLGLGQEPLWVSGMARRYTTKLYQGDSAPGEDVSIKRCVKLDPDHDTLQKERCDEKLTNKAVCYDVPKQPPRYSSLSKLHDSMDYPFLYV